MRIGSGISFSLQYGAIAALVSLAISASLLTSQAGAASESLNLQPVEPGEVAAYAEDFNVSTSVASETMALQAEESQLPLELEQALGNDYAGLWFDNSTGDFVIPITNDTAARTVSGDIPTDDADFRTQPVQSTWNELEVAQHKLNTRLFGSLPPRTVQTYLDAEANAVGVKLATTAASAYEPLVHTALSSVDVRTILTLVEPEQLAIVDLACSEIDKICDPPVRGGTWWGYPSGLGQITRVCSVGFPTTGNQFGNRFFLTAGHCINPKEGTFRDAWTEKPNPENFESARLGSLEEFNNGPAAEWAKFKTNGTEYDQGTSTPMIAAWGEGQEYKILSESSSYKGEEVCHSGATTGVSCGPVNFLDVTVEAHNFPFEPSHIVEHETFFGPVCADHGDSGGPVYGGHTALGIINSAPETESQCGKEAVYGEIIRVSDETGTHIGPRVGQQPVVKVEGYPPKVNGTTVVLRGTVDPNGILTNFHFDYGLTTAYGKATVPNGAGEGFYPGEREQEIAELQPNTTYHYRLVAQNSAGTAMSNDFEVTTGPPPAPTAESLEASPMEITKEEILSGSIDPKGTRTKGWAEYRGAGESGVSESITIEGGEPQRTYIFLTGRPLVGNAAYEFRIVAQNGGGTEYGAWVPFTTPAW